MIDNDFILKDAGLVKIDAAGTVGGEAVIADLGAGLVEGNMVVDVSAIEVADNDEIYKISLQGSTSAAFASGIVDLAILELGAAEVTGGDADSAIGRYILPFRTEKNGTVYQYVRAYCDVDGTLAAGINFTAHLTKK